MILAAAQTNLKRFDIDANLKEHYKYIELAAQRGANFILFPELSISGYEREHAKELAFVPNDARLEHFKELSHKHDMTIVAGAPISINNDLYIGAFVIDPNYKVRIYTKQFLHEGEELFYQPSFDYNPMLDMDEERISLAICADIDHPEHAANACRAASTIYAAGIFFLPQSVSGAHETLSGYAQKHTMCVLMANCIGQVWDYQGGGKSAFWDASGKLIAQLSGDEEGLLLVQKDGNNWKEV